MEKAADQRLFFMGSFVKEQGWQGRQPLGRPAPSQTDGGDTGFGDLRVFGRFDTAHTHSA
jgi:hypothetical protein